MDKKAVQALMLTLTQVGASYHRADKSRKTRYHIRAIVDNSYIVTRLYSYTQRRWVYEIEPIKFIETIAKAGFIVDVKRAKQ